MARIQNVESMEKLMFRNFGRLNTLRSAVQSGLVSLSLALMASSAANATAYSVTSTADTLTAGTLRYALTHAVSNDTVTFNIAASGSILLTGPLPTITVPITVNGSGNKNPVDGQGLYSIFAVANTTGTVNLKNLYVQKGYAAPPFAGGAGVKNSGNLAITNCIIDSCTYTNNSNSQTGYGGGGIKNTANAFLTITGSTIKSCVTNMVSGSWAQVDGGGIDNWGSLTVDTCTFQNNQANGCRGGAIHGGVWSNLTVINSTFTTNTASATGGGISNDGTLSVTGSTFSGNTVTAGGAGGAIISSGSVTDSSFTSNSVPYGSGGALYGITTCTHCLFQQNSANLGGAVMVTTNNGWFDGCTFVSNSSNVYGGAIAQVNAGFSNCTFYGNTCSAARGTAIYTTGNPLPLINCTFTGHTGNVVYAYQVQAITLLNTILWDPGATEVNPDSATGPYYVYNCDINGG
jgi:predicted outer membrane repeat protein